MILYRYSKEKFCLDHSREFKGKSEHSEIVPNLMSSPFTFHLPVNKTKLPEPEDGNI